MPARSAKLSQHVFEKLNGGRSKYRGTRANHSTGTDGIRAFSRVLKNTFVAGRVGKNDVGVTAWSMQGSGTSEAMPQIWMPG